jgi:signal transduction histidine kinase
VVNSKNYYLNHNQKIANSNDNYKILVVDDQPVNLKLLNAILKTTGYKVITEQNGLNAIQKVHEEIPDLILLDIMLPEITGFEICEQLQTNSRTQGIPIIFMTALTETEEKVKGFSLGAVDYITKPFHKEELLARIQNHLHLKTLITSLEQQNQELKELIERNEDLENRVAERTAELKAALEKEKELNQLKSQFVSLVSHEFRTPLAIISSSSGILQHFSDRLSEEKKQKHLQTIQTTINDMTQLLEDVLMINRAEINNLKFNPNKSDIIAFCLAIKEEIESTSQEHTINFSWSSEIEIIDNSLMVQFDKTLLRQIIYNLLNNAIKYSPQEKIVKFNLNANNHQLKFTISDHGIGIPEKDQDQLFTSFHRASNVGTISGTGLGLSIVKKCVEVHQGKISLHSKVGEGTTFTVIIPSRREKGTENKEQK